MKARPCRTWLIAALLSCSLVAALVLAFGLNLGPHDATAPAPTAVMLLQGSPDAYEGSAAPDVDTAKAPACTHPDCPRLRAERAIARTDNRLSNDGKALAALGDDVQPKSRD